MTDANTSAGRRYLATAGSLVERLATTEWPRIEATATAMADALAAGHVLH